MPSQDMISLSERESLIRATMVFRNLNVNEISQLAGLMREVSVKTGETVVKENDLIDSIYIIADGTLEVTKQVEISGNMGTTFLALLNTGDNIGLKDTGLFTKTGERSATVTAQTPCVLLKIDIKDFDTFLKQNPQTLQSMKEVTDVMLRMQFIKESNPFVHLSNQRIAWLASSVKTTEVDEGEILFKENDPVDNCYMIVDGIVEISTQDKNGNTKVVSTLKEGQLFGEQALFKNSKRTTTARATTASRLMVLDRDTLEELKLDTETKETKNRLFSQVAEYNQPQRLENIIHHRRVLDDSQVITTLKNPATSQYLQLNEEGWYIWQLLNGQMTIKQITHEFSEHYKRFDPQTVTSIINMIIDAGFAKADVTLPDSSVSSTKSASEAKNFVDRFEWIYAIKNPDRSVTKLYKYFGLIFFSMPSLLVIILTILVGSSLFPQTLNGLFTGIHQLDHLLLTIIWVLFLTSILSLINPLAKALTLKYFNHSISNFAIGLRFFFPIALVDTSDLWDSSRFQRCITMLSGIIARILIASILTIFVYCYPQSSFALTATMCALFLYFFTLRSLDPLLDLDGYLALENALDAPKLRESALGGFNLRKSNLPSTSKINLTRKQRNIYFLYYLFYVSLNFIFIFILQNQLRSFGLALWSDSLIYLLLLAGLILELVIEMNHQKKMLLILAAGSNSEEI